MKNMGKTIICIVIVLIVGFVGLQKYSMTKNKTDYGSNRNVYQGGDKTAIVVYQPGPLSKSVDKVAEIVTKQLVSDGYTVTVDYMGKHIESDLSAYDVVVFGSAAYTRNVSPVAKEVMSRITEFGQDPNVNFFSVGMLDDTPELEDVKEMLGEDLNSITKFKANGNNLEGEVVGWVKDFD